MKKKIGLNQVQSTKRIYNLMVNLVDFFLPLASLTFKIKKQNLHLWFINTKKIKKMKKVIQFYHTFRF